jgi:photosystem II stability/assembly factor-like uncharacterized protein
MSPRTARSFLWCLWSLLLVFAIHPVWGASGTWTPVGPGSGHSHHPTFAVLHPASPGWIWAGLPQGGPYRSTDRGTHWTWAGLPIVGPWYSPAAVAADPSLPRALWGATSNGFFWTEDGGVHWTLVAGESFASLNPEPQEISVVSGTLYVSGFRKLLASTDGGRSWVSRFETSSLGENAWIEKFAVEPSAPEALYLSVIGPEVPTLLRSLDAGQTWTTLPSPVPGAIVNDLIATPQGVYAAVDGDSAGLFRSTDRGQTWKALLGGTVDRTFGVTSVAADPWATRTLYVAGTFLDQEPPHSALWVSRNAGRTWTKAGPFPGGHLLIDSVAGALYAIGTDSIFIQLKRSLDGGATWTAALQAPGSGSSVARLSFFPADPARQVLTVGWTSYLSPNGGRSWRLLNVPHGIKDIAFDPRNPNRLIAVTSSDGFLSRDGGRTWQNTTRGLWYIELLERVDEQTLLAGGAGLYRSGDNGKSWQTVLAGWPKGSETGRWAQKIAAAPASDGGIYALTFLVDDMELPHGLLVDYPSFLWRSTDDGRTWRKTAANLRTFAVDPVSGRLYGVRNRSLLASEDGGRSWQRIARTPSLVHDLIIDLTDPNTFYVSGAGVWRSRDRGATWEQIASDWDPVTLKLHPTDPRVLYGVDDYGVFKRVLP